MNDIKNTKLILFTVIIGAMILPFGMMNVAEAENGLVEKQAEPKEFVGEHKTVTNQIGSYLYIKHTYTSNELNRLGVDHVFREEIHPITPEMTQEDISELVDEPKVKTDHKMTLVHGDDVGTFDKIRHNNTEISTHAFQQWNIVKSEEDNTQPKKVGYRFISHVEDWASKQSGNAYQSHDPINLIWSDTISEGSTLLSKINTEMSSSGWNDSCVYSNDLYINIGGTWTVQDEHYIDQDGIVPCNQFHARAWEINDNSVIGSAHEEVAKYKTPWDRINIQHISTSGPNYTEYNAGTIGGFYHGLIGFDSAEDEVTGEFTGGCWSSAADSHNMGNEYTRKYFRNTILESTAYNDGYATVINCS